MVIGGGSGGYAAARTARDLGAHVAIIDQGPLGGLCILQGCMPSKALIASGEAAQRVRDAVHLGIETTAPQPNIQAIIERKRRLIDEFAAYRIESLERFTLFKQSARFISSKEVMLADGTIIRGRRFVVATGSAIVPDVLSGLAEVGSLDSDAILDSTEVPRSVIVLGAGYVGCELGQYLHNLGSDVTLMLRSEHVLSGEDHDVGHALTDALRAQGIRIETGVTLERAERTEAGRKRIVYQRNGEACTLEADEIAMCLGRLPRIDLDLDAAGVRAHAMTGIEVDATLRTSQSHIFAVGDVTGLFPLVHVAIYQGEIAGRNAVNDAHEEADYSLQKAHTIFTDPQVGIAGATERQLQAEDRSFISASYTFADHGKAMTLARTQGFVKIIASPDDGRILGAAVVGPEGSELIHELLVAIHFRATVFDFIKIPHLHPTLAEIWTYPAEEIVEQIQSNRAIS